MKTENGSKIKKIVAVILGQMVIASFKFQVDGRKVGKKIADNSQLDQTVAEKFKNFVGDFGSARKEGIGNASK